MWLAIDPDLFLMSLDVNQYGYGYGSYLEALLDQRENYTIALDANGLRDQYTSIFAALPDEFIQRENPIARLLDQIVSQRYRCEDFTTGPADEVRAQIEAYEECDDVDRQLLVVAARAKDHELSVPASRVRILVPRAAPKISTTRRWPLCNEAFRDRLAAEMEWLKVEVAYPRGTIGLPGDEDELLWKKVWPAVRNGDETLKLELKQELDVTADNGKRKLIKEVAGIANSGPGEGYLIVGVMDRKHRVSLSPGDSLAFVKGVPELNESERGERERQINNLLKAHLNPVISSGVELKQLHHTTSNRWLQVIIIPESQSRPHEISAASNLLPHNHVYVRRGGSDAGVDTATAEEVHDLVADRRRRLGG